jgi:hypothetical protein
LLYRSNAWFTACFKNDERIITKAVEAHNNLVEQLKSFVSERDFRTQCIFQPVPKRISEHSAAGGGNVMGLEHHASDGVLFLLSAMMKTPEQQIYARSKVKEAVESVKAYAGTIDGNGNLPWIYMNYADKTQNVLQGYGTKNVKRLKETAAKYDPQEIFQSLCPGGWKVSHVQ